MIAGVWIKESSWSKLLRPIKLFVWLPSSFEAILIIFIPNIIFSQTDFLDFTKILSRVSIFAFFNEFKVQVLFLLFRVSIFALTDRGFACPYRDILSFIRLLNRIFHLLVSKISTGKIFAGKMEHFTLFAKYLNR